MPIYEYACTDCGHKLEILQKMNDSPLEQCPVCHQNALKKLISAAAFHLKGTGWYETDFKGTKKSPKSEEKDTTSTATPSQKKETSNKPSSTSNSGTGSSPAGVVN